MNGATGQSVLRRDGSAYASLDAGFAVRLRAAARDVADGLRAHESWRYLAVEQVKNSYRRTVLGPWWLTAQQAVYVGGLAFVFGQLFHEDLRVFLPYVAVGFLSYGLILGLLRANANVFIAQAATIKSTRQPLTSLVLRNVAIECIQFGHNAIISIFFFPVGYLHVGGYLALVPLALLTILLNGTLLGLWLGPLVARFRDVSPAIDSLLSVAIFFSPVFYRVQDLHGLRATLIKWNPLSPFIDMFRTTFFGQPPVMETLIAMVVYTVMNFILAAVVFARARSHVPYWVS